MASPWVHRVNFMLGSAITQPTVGRTLSRVYRGVIPSRGFHIDATSPWITDSIKASLFWGLYERAEVDLIKRFLKPGTAVIELGGSIGYTALHVARKRPRAQVVVEANPRLIEAIERNLRANDVRHVDIIHGAIDYGGRDSVSFRMSDDNLGSSVADLTTPADRSRIDVPVQTLSSVRARAGIDRYALVCDIEGAEAGMIVAEDAATREACELMIIELHEPAVHAGERFTIERLAARIEETWKLRRVGRNDNVFVFAR